MLVEENQLEEEEEEEEKEEKREGEGGRGRTCGGDVGVGVAVVVGGGDLQVVGGRAEHSIRTRNKYKGICNNFPSSCCSSADGGVGGEGVHLSLVGETLPWVLVDPHPALRHQDHALLKSLKEGDSSFSCRVFLVDLSNGLDESLAFEFLESIHLYLWPYAAVVIYGKGEDMNAALRNNALRNTVHALYLATEKLQGGEERMYQVTLHTLASSGGGVWVKCFTRCLYCKAGECRAPPTDFSGHRFSIVTLDWYPFMDFRRDSTESATTVTPQDSLDVRILNTLTRTLNFTWVCWGDWYEMRVPWDDQWGTSTPSGNWTGVVGTLQYHKADFSLLLSWLRGRYQVVEYSRIYVNEPIVMIMLKPGPLPQYLALIRPLSGETWAALFLSTVSAGLILWALQWAWGRACGQTGLSLDTSILYTWSILFEEPPPHIPTNMSGRSQGTANAIDSFEQMLDEGGWTWGYEPSYGAGWEWFKTNTNPIIKRIYQGMEVLEFPEQMERVLKGRHALITWKYKIKSLVAALYTDEYGNTPIYTARQVYFNYGGKGAPFRRAIDLQKQRMIEAGLIPQWINDLIGTKAKKARDQFGKETSLEKDWAKNLQQDVLPEPNQEFLKQRNAFTPTDFTPTACHLQPPTATHSPSSTCPSAALNSLE
ncbi:hypothetical protein O3P69_018612 [Scylla paramamosain]|uniref:Ionotropic glutamate receptor L-glutamate and glycine-binding domain-containing protein n=1 Tax=Scylla paramamosain TaxID=85552 RepID=A0AAW0T321_SCYPA